MEHATPKELREARREMRGIVRGDLSHNDVAGLQIIKALLKEIGRKFADGFLYRVIQDVANEARRRCLLINPNPFDRTMQYSDAVGNVQRMLPSAVGWEQTKGILSRQLKQGEEYLQRLKGR